MNGWSMRNALLLGLSLLHLLMGASAASEAAGPLRAPGVVIDHSPASSGLYIGSPGLAICTNGDYLASHDFFGPKSREFESATTAVFRSSDRGENWRKAAMVQGAFWSSLFVHRGAVYLMGTDKHHGRIVIRRSSDQGSTWTEPRDGGSGLLTPSGEYHTAPMPIVEHEGRLWRAFEDAMGGTKWGERYRASMLSVSVDADLLTATNWVFSNFVPSERSWNGGDMGGWLEGNAVLAPDGRMVNMLRVQTSALQEKAAIVRVSADGRKSTFGPDTGFVNFPGGAKKFTIRHDRITGRYWSLPTVVATNIATGRPAGIRNTLAISSSKDLQNWTVHKVLLYHPDVQRHGFQYVEWLFDGEDLIAACRTAFGDEEGGARNNHDANYLTFHRIEQFRTLATNSLSWEASRVTGNTPPP